MLTRSARKQKRIPLESITAAAQTPRSGRKSTTGRNSRRSSSAASVKSKSVIVDDNENSSVNVSTVTTDSAQIAELQNLSELDSSTMSTSGDNTASLGDLAKLMQSDEDSMIDERANRRQTADPAQLRGIFDDESSDDESDDEQTEKAATPTATKVSSPVQKSPVAPAQPTPNPKPLKSCLSARKSRSTRSAVKNRVRFGSPEAAEYHKHEVTSAVTPLPKDYTRKRYRMISSEDKAKEARDIANENDRILEEAENETDESEVELSSRLTASERRRNVGKHSDRREFQAPRSSQRRKSSWMPRSPSSEKKSLKKVRRSPRLRKAANTSTEAFEDELRAIAPLPSPMDRRRSSMPNFNILNAVDANYDDSTCEDQPANESVDTEYSENFEDMSVDESHDKKDTTSRRLSMSSVASEMSGADLTVPLQSLNDLVKKNQTSDNNSDDESEDDYTRDFDESTEIQSPAAKNEDHTVELPKLKSMYNKTTVESTVPTVPDLSHMEQFAATKSPKGDNTPVSSDSTVSVVDESLDTSNTVELPQLQQLIKNSSASDKSTTAVDESNSVEESDDEIDDADNAEHTVPLGSLADLYKGKDKTVSTPSPNASRKKSAGVSVVYPPNSPYPGDMSSMSAMFTPETTPAKQLLESPATTPKRLNESMEPVAVSQLIQSVGVNFVDAAPQTDTAPDATQLSTEELNAWTPALNFLTDRLCTETEELEKMTQEMENNLSTTNPPLLRSFQNIVFSQDSAAAQNFKQGIMSMVAASSSEAEKEWLNSIQKSLLAQVSDGMNAIVSEITTDATDFAQLGSEIDELIEAVSNTTSSSSATDQVTQNQAIEQQQAELIRQYEAQINELTSELNGIAIDTKEMQGQIGQLNATIAVQASNAISQPPVSSVNMTAPAPNTDFVSKYRQLQHSLGWRLESSVQCSGTDCINGTAHTFSYCAASSRSMQRVNFPALEMRVSGSGIVSSIQFKAAPGRTLAPFWSRACPVVRPACDINSVVDYMSNFNLACARVATIVEEVVSLQTRPSTDSLVRWVGGSTRGPASMKLLLRFSTNKSFRGPSSQFQVTIELGDFASQGRMDLSGTCAIRCIFGVVTPATVKKAIANACGEQAYAFGCLTRVHDNLLALVTRSRC